MQFVIFLSALLASLTGLVAGERQPVRAQVEMSAVASAVADRTVAVAQPIAGVAMAARPTARPAIAQRHTGPSVPVTPTRTRLSLKQSWLF